MMAGAVRESTLARLEFYNILVRQGKVIPLLTLVISLLGFILGCLCLFYNTLESYPVVLLGCLSILLIGLVLFVRRREGYWAKLPFVFAGLCMISLIVLLFIPEYVDIGGAAGFVDTKIHHSVFSGLLLLAITLPTTSFSLRYLLGSSPSAHDISRYPLFILPVIFVLIWYGIILFHIFDWGIDGLSWGTFGDLKYPIRGTFIFIGLTCLISLPIGVGTGAFLSEYGGRLSGLVGFAITLCRSISVYILALSALGLVTFVKEADFLDRTFIWEAIVGYKLNETTGIKFEGYGTVIPGAIFMSVLVIPVIARATEEGFRSLPRELREGSLALGATEGRTFTHVLLPWALPNIVTGLLLGCAEAAGMLAVVMFLTRSYSNNPLFGHVNTLSTYIFMSGEENRFNASIILLLLCLGFTLIALILKRIFAKRYRGA